MDARVRGEFSRGSTRKAKYGKAPVQAAASPKRKKTRRKNRLHQLAMLALVAFIFINPDAREYVLAQWAEMQEYAMEGLAPYQVYPLEADYTIERSIELVNTHSSNIGTLRESIPIPSNVSSNEIGAAGFAYQNGDSESKFEIQRVHSMVLLIDGDTISIPHDGTPHKSKSQAVITSAGNLVWWPSKGSTQDYCPHGACVRVEYSLAAGQSTTIDFQVELTSTTHTWWHSTRMDSKINGKSDGVSVDRSGSFDEISERGSGVRDSTFGSQQKWYDRSMGEPPSNWAIDGSSNALTVAQVAASIEAGLPAGLQDNVYAFSRATFDWLNTNIPYDVAAPIVARGGEQCLAEGLGDCDEQSNAFMSILRTKDVPTWYVFGALTDTSYSMWEGHGWAYVMIPLSTDWCESRSIILETCFIEGSVDVVNRKWLVHTPTAYIDWVETPDSSWETVDGYYSGGSMSSYLERTREFSTIGSADINGGTWNNKWLEERLS